MDKLKEEEFMAMFSNDIIPVYQRVAELIDGTRPVQVPMVWSTYYPERVWAAGTQSNAVPCLRVPNTYADITMTDTTYSHSRHSPIDTILEASTDIMVLCEPCWETYKRWSTVIIDDFYKAMRAVKEAYGIKKWRDASTPKVQYGNPHYTYMLQKGDWLETVSKKMDNPLERYGERIMHQRLNVGIIFRLEIPTPPAEERNLANCHVVEEKVTETVTRSVKSVRCL